MLQAPENHQAEQKSQERSNDVEQYVPLSGKTATETKVAKGRQVYSHKSQQGPEIQKLDCSFPRHGQGSDICEHTDDRHIVVWVSSFGVQMAENLSGKKIVAPHTVQQAHSTQVSGESARQTRYQQNYTERRKKMIAAYYLRDIHERRFGIGKGAIVRPDALRQIHLQSGEKPGENANQNRCE